MATKKQKAPSRAKKSVVKKPAAKVSRKAASVSRPRSKTSVTKKTVVKKVVEKARPPKELGWKPRAKWLLKWAGIPMAVYFVFFCLYSWPWIANFNTHYMTDAGDGLQNVWNIWWVNKSVTELHQLPWHTYFLHAPHGVTLLGQTLNPFNGFVAIPLLTFLTLTQAFNVMVVFSFVFGGLTAFWLCYYFSRNYLTSVIGGFVFTFSSYHFAHAIGHMQLVSLEWIPLFILLWWMLLKKPSFKLAAGASLTLLLVLFCDYYYFMYCVMAAVVIVLYFWATKQLPPIKTRKTWLPIGLFIALSLIIVAPLPLALLRLNSREVLTGSHPTRPLSTNVIAPFLDGGFWRFRSLTDWYWDHVPSAAAESSVYIGLSVLAVAIIGILKRRKINRDIVFWIVLALVFGIFSYGPRLMIANNSIELIPLPYSFLEKVIPPLKLSGVPVRMMVMVTLSMAVICSLVLARLKLSQTKSRVLMAAFCGLLFIEMFPLPLPNTPNVPPNFGYVQALKNLPPGIVFDDAISTSPYALFNQTFHEKPIVLGYISRTPESVEAKDWLIVAALLEHRNPELCTNFKVRYYTTAATKPLIGPEFPVVYRDQNVLIYDLKNSPNC